VCVCVREEIDEERKERDMEINNVCMIKIWRGRERECFSLGERDKYLMVYVLVRKRYRVRETE
jgi:hypothetical protein